MIEISRYDKSRGGEVKKLFPVQWEEINYSEDVLADTISIATDGGKLVGICYLVNTPSIDRADRETPGYLNAAFEGAQNGDEIETSGILINTLINDYRAICTVNKDKRLILRTFSYVSMVDYMSYLATFGFRAQNFMYRMKKDLSDVTPVNLPECFSFEVSDDKGLKEEINVTAVKVGVDGKIEGLDGYFEANASAFGIPDSEKELEYRLRRQNGVQFIARADGRVVGAVSVWENKNGCVSTENIFCIREYRRRGITETILRRVLSHLSYKGYREAVLYVYGVNIYAIELYMKLGYEIVGGTVHMLYEDGYEPEMV